MDIKKDIIGKRFTRLYVIAYLDLNKFKHPEYSCLCICGKQTRVSRPHLLQGYVKSCGCLAKPHGMSNTSFFNVWMSMIKRCRLKSRKDWHRYGGRGIKVSKRWKTFLNFKEDMYKEYIKHKKNNKTTLLDRTNNNKGYSKNNCEWVAVKKSTENRVSTHWITFNGKKQTLSDWARELNIKPSSLLDRLNKLKWSKKKALTTYKLKK